MRSGPNYKDRRKGLKIYYDVKMAQIRHEGYGNLTGGPKGGMCYKDLQGAAKEGLKRFAYTYFMKEVPVIRA